MRSNIKSWYKKALKCSHLSNEHRVLINYIKLDAFY